jgi:hypothetical protein
MRTIVLCCVLAAAGCATVSSASGESGAAVVSGEDKSLGALTGAATDEPATNGSDTTGEAVPSTAKPGAPVLPGGEP